MTFRVGQRVVCIDASDPAGHNGIVQGNVYVIARLCREFLSVPETGKCLWLRSRFRPVVEPSTDISVFAALLNPNNHSPLPEDAPVKVPERQF